MTLQQMNHVGVVVTDLAAAVAFFVELGLEADGEPARVEGRPVERIVGLENVSTNVVFVRVPGGGTALELIEFRTPAAADGDPGAPANAPGLRHLAFVVDDIEEVLGRLEGHGAELVGEVVRWEDSFRLCYVRGPEGIIVELVQQLG